MNVNAKTFPYPTGKIPPYQLLAAIYDKIMKHVNYQHWSKYITTIIRKHYPSAKKILDVGCGTGAFIYELTKFGFEIDGCDPSPAMLEIAKKKNPSRNFWKDQLPELREFCTKEYQVICCLYDTLNYLSTIDIVTKAIQRIYALLPEEGLFIFDVVSESLCQRYFHLSNEQEILDDKYAYSRKSFYDKKHLQQINEFYIYTPDGIFQERHVQNIFSFHDIQKKVLEKTCFKIIGIYENFSFLPADEKSNRAHFVLKR